MCERVEYSNACMSWHMLSWSFVVNMMNKSPPSSITHPQLVSCSLHSNAATWLRVCIVQSLIHWAHNFHLIVLPTLIRMRKEKIAWISYGSWKLNFSFSCAFVYCDMINVLPLNFSPFLPSFLIAEKNHLAMLRFSRLFFIAVLRVSGDEAARH